MTTRISSIHIRNYRVLADVRLDLGPVGVLFGPNGAGKSTLLDSLWFVRDCAIRGVELASASRSHGIGILFDGATEEDQRVEIALRTDTVEYALKFDLASGRINPSPGELLTIRETNVVGDVNDVRIERKVGNDHAELYNSLMGQSGSYKLPDPDKLTLSLYRSLNPTDEEAGSLDSLLHYVRHYYSRSFLLHRLTTQGSDSSPEVRLWKGGDNLWSVLRNLHDRRSRDDRFDMIMRYMKRAFPSFEDIALEQTGPGSVYASFIEKDRSRPILASGVSDGHLQLLLILTALFSEGRDRETLILLDEPETSLHPWAIAVLAEAIKGAAERNRQILVATHSPVLISQFGSNEIIAAELEEGRTRLRRLSEIEDIRDLLDEYAAGSLYMSETIGKQAPQTGDQDESK
jgi:predicted ATPase